MNGPARWRRWLLALLALGALQQGLILAGHWAHNPLARVPLDDARVYWSWAGDIAGGGLVGDTPFLSAPLYPYFLGLVRACGGGLLAAYVLQGLMRLATAALLACSGRRLVSPQAGLGAALLYLLLADPAEATGRILNDSLQALLAAALLWQALRVAPQRRPGGIVVFGVMTGLNVLANPPLLAAIPVLVAWLALTAPAPASRWHAPAAAAAAALLTIAPATLHNRVASGEWIAVSAQGGVTFSHGNAAGADGTYHPIPGVTADRVQQNRDAFRVAAEAAQDAAGAGDAHGAGGVASGGWRRTSAYFLRRGLAYWASEPGAAAALLLRKARWFFTGQHYGDVYLAGGRDRREGLWPTLLLAPLPAAWITFPAFAMLLLVWRRWRDTLPLLLLVLVPLAVVLAFFYSPRYRMPALGPMAVLAAWSLHALLAERRRILAGAWLLGPVAACVNARTSFDRPQAFAAQYDQKVGTALLEQGRYPEAEARFRSALQRQPGDPGFSTSLGEALRRQQRSGEALSLLRAAVTAHPEDPLLRRTLAVTLAEEAVTSGDDSLAAEAELEFRRLLQQTPEDWLALDNLGRLLERQGRAGEAVFQFLEGLRWAPENALLAQHLEQALARVLPYFRANAADPQTAAAGAWLVAHLPQAGPKLLDEALAWARAARQSSPSDPDFLDTLAAVHARRGEFADAVAAASAALEAARAGGREDLAGEIAVRLARYQAGRTDLSEN